MLVEGIRGLPRVHQELAEDNQGLAGSSPKAWELTRNAPRVRQKMIETRKKLAKGYREDRWDSISEANWDI
ncbi:hypothetical protein BHM03_00041061 [Ensete ventricosum]|nr:hypothetical protein BHM03_00041061 [Ensete ventricosum]